MMKIKYTTDGKKVRVVGKLNSKEIIVQEIYVDKSGAEISAGENFVVKSLLDSPAVSWKEVKAKEIEAELERVKSYSDSEFKKLRDKQKVVKMHIENLDGVKKYFDVEGLKTLCAFLAGEITHLVIEGYGRSVKIVEFDDAAIVHDSYERFQGIKLISLFGKSNGNIEWRMNEYRDGSGCSWTTILPCKTYAEAQSEAQKMLDKTMDGNTITEDTIKCAQMYGLKIPEEKISEYKRVSVGRLIDRNKNIAEEIERNNAKIKELEG